MILSSEVRGWQFEFSVDWRQWVIGFNFDRERLHPWRQAPYWNVFLGPIRIGAWK